MQQAMAETVGYVNRARAFMPPGTVQPFITRFDPGSVAVDLLLFTSSTHSQSELQNIALNQVRPLFATLPGVSAPPPFGGNQRTIVVTLDPDKLKQYHISPEQAIPAVSTGTVVVPSGNLYDGSLNRIVRTNATLGPDLNDLMNTPVHPGSGTSVYLRDIGSVENGTDIVTAYAHVDGRRTVYIPVTKRANASTLAVISAVKAALPTSLVPVFAIWMMKESHRREETEGLFGRIRTRYDRFLGYTLNRRLPVILGYFAVCAIILLLAVPRLGTEIFPDVNGPVLRMRLKVPVGIRIEETEPIALHALDLISKTIGKQNVEITSDYVGVQPSSYPVNLIHLFTSGPEEALIQVQLRSGHRNDEQLREDLRAAFKKELPDLKLSFEAGDIISQVMSFRSPTPVQIDVQGVDLDQNYAYLAKIEAELHKLS